MGIFKSRYYRHWRLTECQLVLYPAGLHGARMLAVLRRYGVEPLCFCDADREKIGTAIDNLPVRSLEDILAECEKRLVKFIVNSNYYYREIEDRLLGAGIDPDHILSYDIEKYCDTGVIDKPLRLTPEETRRHQEILLDIMTFVHDVCKKYGIRYYLTAGTLLGAVRHKGFIPWDDDLDICMWRSDCGRFFRAVRNELGDKYVVVDLLSRKAVGLKNTAVRHFGVRQFSYIPSNIIIDIIPVDKVFRYPNPIGWLQERFVIFFFACAEKLGWRNAADIPGKIARRLGMACASMFNVLNIGWHHVWTSDARSWYSKRVYADSLVEDLCLLEFEGCHFYAPAMHHEVLWQMFGIDYMTPPPPEKRRAVHPFSELSYPGEAGEPRG